MFHCKAGDALFRKGDAGGEMFVVFSVIGLTAGDSGSKIVGTFTLQLVVKFVAQLRTALRQGL